jgi:hypothetical protein
MEQLTMAVTKRKTRADKVAEQGVPTPAVMSDKPSLPREASNQLGMKIKDKWGTLARQVAAGARLRPRTNSERFTGKRVDYVAYQKKSSAKAHGPAKQAESGAKGGKKQVGK